MGDRALDLAVLGVIRVGELLRMTSAKEAWVAMGEEKSIQCQGRWSLQPVHGHRAAKSTTAEEGLYEWGEVGG